MNRKVKRLCKKVISESGTLLFVSVVLILISIYGLSTWNIPIFGTLLFIGIGSCMISLIFYFVNMWTEVDNNLNRQRQCCECHSNNVICIDSDIVGGNSDVPWVNSKYKCNDCGQIFSILHQINDYGCIKNIMMPRCNYLLFEFFLLGSLYIKKKFLPLH